MGFRERRIRFGVTRPFFGLCAVAVLLASGATSVWAQTSTAGTVAGQVTDESNAAVPGAQVKIADPGTGTEFTTVTNNDGRYTFSSVPPGTYNVGFTKTGFSTYDVNKQAVDVGQVLTLNAKLKVGSTATTVEVTASAGSELQTMNCLLYTSRCV